MSKIDFTKTITIIDTFGFLFRSYYALPPLKSSSGFPTGLLTGFMNMILNIGKDYQTDYIIFALDSKGDTFRNEIYPQYKAHRPDVPEDLLKQLPVAIEWIQKMGFVTASKDGYEADDIIASIVNDAKNHNIKSRVISHDKDLYQLLDDKNEIFLYDPIKKVKITEQTCLEKYGVEAKYFIHYQSLLGDSADNVPGVKGVGKKTAEILISQYHTLDNLYANIDNLEKPRWAKLLLESKELAYISKELVTLKNDIYKIDNLDSCLMPQINPILKIEDELKSYELNRIIDRVHKEGLSYKTKKPEKKPELFKPILLNNDKKLLEIINQIPKDSIIAFDTETTSLDTKEAKIVGFSFCYEEDKKIDKAYYVPINHFYLGVEEQVSFEVAKEAIKLLSNFKLVAQNFKYDYAVIKHNFDIELNIFADTMIMSWLENSSTNNGMDSLAKRFLNITPISYKDTVKKGENFSNVNINQACKYASEDAYITLKLYQKFDELLEKEIKKIAEQIEYPFIKTLYNIESRGIKLDVEFFEFLKQKTDKQLQDLTSEIYALANSEFNINSTKQLGVILFEKLGLRVIKKTKTGYSTNEQVLNELKDEHPIIPKLLNYRELFKLKSTYIDPLILLAKKNKDHKIFTTFLHTGTATGRLSSKDPNLQNIPVRTEIGREIRQGFIADNNKKLISIDYSQIELRLLAHFSKDEALVKAFRDGLDIHLQTAIKIFGEENAKENRHIAKTINFGLIYGMGARKLAQTLEIDNKTAKSYIDSYFASFPTVKDFIANEEKKVQEIGFITTIIGRKRYFDFESANGMQRAGFLREAVNSIFQGSASDIIKLAMNKIEEKYQNDENIKMLLQIHDELIFEVKQKEAQKYANELKDIMENTISLEVPLTAGVSIGNNWGELK